MPYPAAFLKAEKEFLAQIESRVPHLRAHFKQCEDIYPEDRPRALNKIATRAYPHLWEWLGVEPAQRKSYAAINGLMAKLAFEHPHDDYNLPTVLTLVRHIHLPDLIAGDINGHGLTKNEIDRTHELAMRFMLGSYGPRKLWETWQGVADPKFHEAQWTRDLRRIALAVIARDYRASLPAAAHKIDALTVSLNAGLETDHGRAVMAGLMGYPPCKPRPDRADFDLD